MLELVIRLVASLAAVIGLMLLLARFVNKRYGGRVGAPVQVLHRQPLSRSSSVSVISVGSRVLVVGTTDHQVSLLTELDPDELELGVVSLASDEVDEVDTDIAQPPVPGVIRPITRPTESAKPSAGALSGSVLSPQTWRQALAAAKDRSS